MLLPFIIGLFCLLFTIGIFVSENPLHFSIIGLIMIGAVIFAIFILMVGFALLKG
jgi:hypothetical protein